MTQRVLTILDVKDNLAGALDKDLVKLNALDKASNDTSVRIGNVLNKIDKFANIAIAGVGAIGVGLLAAAKKAKDFNYEFLELKNLNLDKSVSQIRGLENQVLDTAFAVGKLPAATSKAFFDVQSGTGKYGDDVAKIVKQTALFSTAVKSDFNVTLEGAIKGIRNFNLEADDMERFFQSSAKTVQVGITTFDQLARVQTDYAGAANTAGQSFDSANKLFAVFTTKAKSVEEAATLTKSAFTDLLKPQTLKSFQKVGIDVFDKTTGKVKQLDQIVAELNDRFKSVRGNDRTLNGLINQFSGSEGLVALIGEAAKNGDQMLKTFKEFDSVDFKLEDALRNAKADITVMSEIVKNKLDVLFTKLGYVVVPKLVDALDYVDKEILPGLEAKMPKILDATEKFLKATGKTIDQIGRGISWVSNEFGKFADSPGLIRPSDNKANEDKLIREMGFGIEVRQADPRLKAFLAKNFDPGIIGDERRTMDFVSRIERLGLGSDGMGKTLIDNLKGNLASNDPFAKLEELSQRASNIGKRKDKSPMPGPSGGSPASKMAKDVAGVVAGGPQVRNVTVNFNNPKFMGAEQIITNNLSDIDFSKFKQMFERVVLDAVRDSEITAGNGN